MTNELQADNDAATSPFAIVVSRYNESITSRLLSGAVATLTDAGVAEADIDVVWVPGAFELPLAAQTMAESGRYVAVLSLGAVIRGETTHDQHINRAVSLGVMQASLSTGVPIMFGVLTCESVEQAIQRAGGTAGNKGSECAQAALEMARLLPLLRGENG